MLPADQTADRLGRVVCRIDQLVAGVETVPAFRDAVTGGIDAQIDRVVVGIDDRAGRTIHGFGGNRAIAIDRQIDELAAERLRIGSAIGHRIAVGVAVARGDGIAARNDCCRNRHQMGRHERIDQFDVGAVNDRDGISRPVGQSRDRRPVGMVDHAVPISQLMRSVEIDHVVDRIDIGAAELKTQLQRVAAGRDHAVLAAVRQATDHRLPQSVVVNRVTREEPMRQAETDGVGAAVDSSRRVEAAVRHGIWHPAVQGIDDDVAGRGTDNRRSTNQCGDGGLHGRSRTEIRDVDHAACRSRRFRVGIGRAAGRCRDGA